MAHDDDVLLSVMPHDGHVIISREPSVAGAEVPVEPRVAFDVTAKELRELNESKDIGRLRKFGGFDGLAYKLGVDVTTGLRSAEAASYFAEREALFGRNVFPPPPMTPYWKFFTETFKDKTLVLLTIFAMLAIIVGALPISAKNGWIEGLAIIITVIIVALVMSTNNYTKELKFRALNKMTNEHTVKVVRSKALHTVFSSEVEVGDVVQLEIGDCIPADGIYISGHGLGVDESAMTGEPESVRKTAKAPFLMSGCMVTDGSGRMLVTAVGKLSEWGIVKSMLATPSAPTPLQDSVNAMVDTVSWMGVIAAIATFVALLAHFIAEQVALGDAFEQGNLIRLVDIVLESLALVVAVVPEGLPLALTITLAYSTTSMLKDNILVRHLSSCETMGSATNICSDKTGTITENRMTVVQMWACGGLMREDLDYNVARLDSEFIKLLCTSISVNTSAFVNENKRSRHVEFVGNQTECALVVLTNKLGANYKKIRQRTSVVTIHPFSSEKKHMSTAVKRPDSESGVLHVKGGAEIVLGLCTECIDHNRVTEIDARKRAELQAVIESMARAGLRTLAIAFRSLSPRKLEALVARDAAATEHPPAGSPAARGAALPPISDEELHSRLTLVAIIGIEDPVRKDVPAAIDTCKRAGIKVRMVTGDNKLTAMKVARQCGIISSDSDIVLEGPAFRKLPNQELDRLLPRLAVLARSSPADKYRLVMRLRALKEVVAVTGDGTNDGPALKAADVGLSMGVGTEVAKEASDMLIMNDDFISIVNSVVWGRGIRKNIQKFLQYHLTINVVAVGIVLISACVNVVPPLRTLQLLWLNLICDSLAALAFATEVPEPEQVLSENPPGRVERLITPLMWRNIFGYSVFQLLICLLVQYTTHLVLPLNENVDTSTESSIRFTMVFNIFVIMNIFNEINSHRVDDGINVFKGFFNSYIFVIIVFGTAVIQVIIVQFGGSLFNVIPLNWWQWLFCIAVSATIIPYGMLMRRFVPPPQWSWLKYSNTIPWIDFRPGIHNQPVDASWFDDDVDEEAGIPGESAYIEKEASFSMMDRARSPSDSELTVTSGGRAVSRLGSGGRLASSVGLWSSSATSLEGVSVDSMGASDDQDLAAIHVALAAVNGTDQVM